MGDVINLSNICIITFVKECWLNKSNFLNSVNFFYDVSLLGKPEGISQFASDDAMNDVPLISMWGIHLLDVVHVRRF
jgi:hypothetical protein